MSLDPSVAAVRNAVRRVLVDGTATLLVACSGGADSLALVSAAVFEGHKLGRRVVGVTVDHGLQEGSAEQAARVIEQMAALGVDETVTVRVEVAGGGQGPEAAAREARYAVLAEVSQRWEDADVLLGHTLDDQAETVLLGLGRGSGPRSIAGMRPVDGRWLRPLLGVRRETTRAACAAEHLPYRDDPHNADPRYARVRLRTEVLPRLEDALQGGVAEALARTAELVRDDLDALDGLAAALTPAASTLPVDGLAAQPRAIRTRVLRNWVGIPLTAAQLRALDALVADWHGQGPVALPSGRTVRRASGMLLLAGPDR
jgi:tRNA(Ile)-lysidine synthase